MHFACKRQVKEINPINIIKALESDFIEHTTDDSLVSQEDLLFLSKVKEGIRQKEDGYFKLLLPFKTDKPILPNKDPCAVHRLSALER